MELGTETEYEGRRMPDAFACRFADKRAARYAAWFFFDAAASRHKATIADVIDDAMKRAKVFRDKAKLKMKTSNYAAWQFDTLARLAFVNGQWPDATRAIACAALGLEEL
jgi:hypothetical protein